MTRRLAIALLLAAALPALATYTPWATRSGSWQLWCAPSDVENVGDAIAYWNNVPAISLGRVFVRAAEDSLGRMGSGTGAIIIRVTDGVTNSECTTTVACNAIPPQVGSCELSNPNRAAGQNLTMSVQGGLGCVATHRIGTAVQWRHQ